MVNSWEDQARQWWDKAGRTVRRAKGTGPAATHTTRSALIVASDCLALAVIDHLGAQHQVVATIDMVRYDPAIPDGAEVLALAVALADQQCLIPMLPGHTTLRAYPVAAPSQPLGDAVCTIAVDDDETRRPHWVSAEAIAEAIANTTRSHAAA